MYDMGQMALNNDDIKEFQEILERDFNEKVSFDDASIIASRFLRLYELLAQPWPEEKRIELEQENEEKYPHNEEKSHSETTISNQ